MRFKVCGKGHPPVRFSLPGVCPVCPRKRGLDSAARGAQRGFRNALVAASDGRCAYSDADGERCPVTTGLEAAHIGDRYADTGAYGLGALVCAEHHLLLDHG
jgi:hypothetical protein